MIHTLNFVYDMQSYIFSENLSQAAYNRQM